MGWSTRENRGYHFFFLFLFQFSRQGGIRLNFSSSSHYRSHGSYVQMSGLCTKLVLVEVERGRVGSTCVCALER